MKRMDLVALYFISATLPATPWSLESVGPNKLRLYAVTDGGMAGSKADPVALWDEATMAGPLGKLADNLFLARFRGKLAEELGGDESSFSEGYDGLVEMIQQMHRRSSSEVMYIYIFFFCAPLKMSSIKKLEPVWGCSK